MALTHLHFVARPADITVTMTSPTRPSERPLDVGAAILATRRTVEAGAEPDTTEDAAAGDFGPHHSKRPALLHFSAGVDGDDGAYEKGADWGDFE
jgi:hypothetical protein